MDDNSYGPDHRKVILPTKIVNANSNQKGRPTDNSVGCIETTSQIVIDNEKMSDMSFQLNINEIIGSIDEKS